MAEQARRETRTLTIELAPDFRTVVSDSMVINLRTDQIATVVTLAFTRVDNTPTTEEIDVDVGPDGVEQKGPSRFNQPVRKIKEVDVLMRPDEAFKAAMVILETLEKLDEGQKKRYRLPKMKFQTKVESAAETAGENS
jgi:hypothetical protein